MMSLIISGMVNWCYIITPLTTLIDTFKLPPGTSTLAISGRDFVMRLIALCLHCLASMNDLLSHIIHTWNGAMNNLYFRWEISGLPTLLSLCREELGPRLNIKIPFSLYKKSHCWDKMILRPSCRQHGTTYSGKAVSLYWIGPLLSVAVVGLQLHVSFHQ